MFYDIPTFFLEIGLIDIFGGESMKSARQIITEFESLEPIRLCPECQGTKEVPYLYSDEFVENQPDYKSCGFCSGKGFVTLKDMGGQ